MADNRGKVESPLKMFPTLLRKEIKERGTQMLEGTTPGKQLQENGRESTDIFAGKDVLLPSPIIATW